MEKNPRRNYFLKERKNTQKNSGPVLGRERELACLTTRLSVSFSDISFHFRERAHHSLVVVIVVSVLVMVVVVGVVGVVCVLAMVVVVGVVGVVGIVVVGIPRAASRLWSSNNTKILPFFAKDFAQYFIFFAPNSNSNKFPRINPTPVVSSFCLMCYVLVYLCVCFLLVCFGLCFGNEREAGARRIALWVFSDFTWLNIKVACAFVRKESEWVIYCIID